MADATHSRGLKRGFTMLKKERESLLNEHPFLTERSRDGVEGKIYWHFVRMKDAAATASETIGKMQADLVRMQNEYARVVSDLTAAEDAFDACLKSDAVQAYSEDLADRWAAAPFRADPRHPESVKKRFLNQKREAFAPLLRRVDERGIAPKYILRNRMEREARNKQFATLCTKAMADRLHNTAKDIYRTAGDHVVARFCEVYCCLDLDAQAGNASACKRAKSV
jgi:hypothetical protein